MKKKWSYARSEEPRRGGEEARGLAKRPRTEKKRGREERRRWE